MEGAGDHFDFARHPGGLQAFGVGEVLVMEQVDGDLWVRITEVGRSAELVNGDDEFS